MTQRCLGCWAALDAATMGFIMQPWLVWSVVWPPCGSTPGGVAEQPIRLRSNAVGPTRARGKTAPICMRGPVAVNVISGHACNSAHAAAAVLL